MRNLEQERELMLISIHAPHTRSDSCLLVPEDSKKISIHAPHTRSDGSRCRRHPATADFNPRSSYEERRSCASRNLSLHRFQSTLLIRGATCLDETVDLDTVISIHAPHTRSDMDGIAQLQSAWKFQSTLLIRGATRRGSKGHPRRQDFNPRSSYEERRSIPLRSVACRQISIHAPHTRSDPPISFGVEPNMPHFNPRSSYEERPDAGPDPAHPVP